MFGKKLSSIIFIFNNSYEILILIVIRSIIVQFIALFMCDYTLNYRALISVSINIVILVLNIGFSLFFILYKNEGIIGVYKSYIYSNVIVLVYLLISNPKSYKPVINKEMLKKMFKFSGGYIPASLASTILTLSDRYFLSSYISYSETGIYSIGYKFGMLIEPLFVSPFKSIFTPYKFQIWKDKDAQVKLNNMFIKYHFIGCFLILLISFYCKSIILIFTSKEYLAAYKLVPLILLSYFLYEMNSFYSLGIEIKNKTYLESYILIFGGILNIILNMLLIPKYRMYGAAIATITSYIVMNIIYIFYAMPMYSVRYNLRAALKYYVIIITLYLLYYIVSITNINIFLEWIVGLLLLVIYIILCVALNLVKREELLLYIHKIKMKLNFVSN
jgi:O-antigen/teichoic acid export membrane protein